MSHFRYHIAISILAAAGASVLAQPTHPSGKISPDTGASSGSNVAVVIQYTQDPGALKQLIINNLGGRVTGNLHSIYAIAATVPQSGLSVLAADPDVTYVSIDRPVAAREAPTILGAEYTTEPINAPAVWQQGYLGTNIGVAVIDSGINPVPDLAANAATPSTARQQARAARDEYTPASAGRIVYSENFVRHEWDALDHFGHGTHIAGLIGGNGALSAGSRFFRTFYGVAPNVESDQPAGSG